MTTGSEHNYIEHLDKLSALIEKYKDTHNIVIAGDLNGSLSSARNNNHPDSNNSPFSSSFL
jgi:copper homeostasis protein CutC